MRTFRLNSVLAFLVLVVVGIAILLLPSKRPFIEYDEGFAVYNALRLLRGDVPYRDFWAIYPPGQFAMLAVIFSVFGENLYHARLYDIGIRLAIAILLTVITRISTKNSIFTLGSGVFATILLSAAGFYGYAVLPAMALTLCAFACLSLYKDNHAPAQIIVASLLLGVASLFRIDISGYAALALFTLLILQLVLVSKPPRYKIRSLLLLVLPALGVFIIGYGYLASRTGIPILWELLIEYPLTSLHDVRWRPYPSIIPQGLFIPDSFATLRNLFRSITDWLHFYYPLTIFVTTLTVLLLRLRTENVKEFLAKNALPVSLTIFGLLLFNQTLSRFDFLHALPAVLISIVLTSVLLHQTLHKAGQRYSLLCTAFFCLSLGAISVYTLTFGDEIVTLARSYPLDRCHAQIARAGCVRLNSAQQQAVLDVVAATPPTDRIFVGNQRHDKTFINDIGFYFLADRQSASYYHELHPGVTTTRHVQEIVVNEISEENVRLVVLVTWPDYDEPNASSRSSGIHTLDDYIHNNYEKVGTYEQYEIWMRK